MMLIEQKYQEFKLLLDAIALTPNWGRPNDRIWGATPLVSKFV